MQLFEVDVMAPAVPIEFAGQRESSKRRFHKLWENLGSTPRDILLVLSRIIGMQLRPWVNLRGLEALDGLIVR